MPMRQIYYFAPHVRKYDSSNFSAYSVFLGMGFVFLLLVCMNHVSLATSRALGRAREIGLRKTVGAARGQLVRQFLCESVLLAFLALPLSFLAYESIAAALTARLGLEFNQRRGQEGPDHRRRGGLPLRERPLSFGPGRVLPG